ncbi:penicillin-binding protein activator [Tanticharoenia sakaeratensis]|uniref:Uncharacterized protein n=1 Tax=Tanticharoenia sakaeratensis NBRC 103193 TaxID=1231623 RepID=A0A0D6MHZ6_9PROT|nr:penicillin-binding protein activator [Tanticharoenia sakaeratensis]GAN53249.1 hypothetical protein Tasa_009_044 [Tanticharoenia sakaeratensis NBRC 103193]GBQ21188.1 amino acid ABC transporter substrate-binding protein [Tanticharoenia sakaeratensis NBRC 103193]
MLALGLAACAGGGSENTPAGGVGGLPPAPATPQAASVGALLPLSGPMAGLGHEMLDAMHLALPSGPSMPEIDAHDTAAPGGADTAAREAIGHGDKLLLGPLTASDTAKVAPLAIAANTPVLAFTSDTNRAQAGVWTLGLTPEQQVRRMVSAAKAAGRQHFAAFLPDNALGHAMGQALVQACADEALAPPNVVYHGPTADAIRGSLRTLSAFDSRQASTAPAQPPASQSPVDPAVDPTSAGQPAAPSPAPVTPPANQPAAPLAPPPFDALLLADTGLQLGETISALQADQVSGDKVQIMGPALWDAFATKLSALSGAWYAAPDPAARQGFLRSFRLHYKITPTPVAYLAFDAAAIAGIMAHAGYDPARLTQSQGFSGTDGVFALSPDGHVARSLAIFAIQKGGGSQIAIPAPASAHS